MLTANKSLVWVLICVFSKALFSLSPSVSGWDRGGAATATFVCNLARIGTHQSAPSSPMSQHCHEDSFQFYQKYFRQIDSQTINRKVIIQIFFSCLIIFYNFCLHFHYVLMPQVPLPPVQYINTIHIEHFNTLLNFNTFINPFHKILV